VAIGERLPKNQVDGRLGREASEANQWQGEDCQRTKSMAGWVVGPVKLISGKKKTAKEPSRWQAGWWGQWI
jgi:hypothetical protein